MKPEDKNRFKELLVSLGELYDKSISANLATLYWHDFSEYPINVFEKAVSDHRKDPDQGMFFPKPAHLMRQIEGTTKNKQNALEAKALSAWNEFVKHLRLRGHREPFKIEDGAALAALRAMGGMSKLALLKETEIEWAGKDFTKLYIDNMSKSEPLEGGVLSIVNQSNHQRIESPQKTPEEIEENKRLGHEALKSIMADIKGSTSIPKEARPAEDDQEKKRLALEKIKQQLSQFDKDNNNGK